MSNIKFLPAMYGDAFIIHCQKDGEEGVVVVDGGPSSNGRMNVFVNEVEKYNPIDLMILTHQDKDHIEGILHYVTKHKKDEPFPVKRLWVNCARKIHYDSSPDLSPSQASNLADAFNEIEERQDLCWKEKIVNRFDTSDISFADIDILSPDKYLLERFLPVYEQRAEGKGVNLTAGEQKEEKPEDVSLEELVTYKKDDPSEANYQEFVNMATIAFILRCDGLSILMLGDSFPKQIEAALREREFSLENKLKVDFVKVAHHGSRNNISNDLLDLIDCDNFLISTNGGAGKSKHPDREALANIICHPGRDRKRTVHLHFNYSVASIESANQYKLFKPNESKDYNFEIHEPDGTGNYEVAAL